MAWGYAPFRNLRQNSVKSPDLLPRAYLNPRPGGVPDHLAPEALMAEVMGLDFQIKKSISTSGLRGEQAYFL